MVAIAATVVATCAATPSWIAGADATPLFDGSYTVTKKTAPTDPATGAGLSDQPSTWIVSSSCAFLGCLADVVSDSLTSFTMLYQGTSWTRLATGDTGLCRGAAVPATSSAMRLVPQGGGSLTGVRTVTLRCGDASVDLSQALTLTPSRA
ncbi:hypothetical protein MMAD_42610 [Mycolicibacterium madagascariense]|uniref:Uncharacterized protein n=2 Tax=Mycolicibacterium madagascariense TaxID=212765 RepID=A0A7I7XL87_9MYCO|nr:hypothetical protein MMAD_42610 [Mycolicibacterium madagascariense]